MIVPNKAVPYDESLLSRLPRILQALKTGRKTVAGLYRQTQGDFWDINQFLLSVDMLFILGKIEIVGGEINYVD